MEGLFDFQLDFARSGQAFSQPASGEYYSIAEVVEYGQPTVLVGVSGQPGLFSESLIKSMLSYTERPVVMPLSNPTSRVEGTPQDVLNWTNGNAIVATGSPFDPVDVNGSQYPIAQCNNSYIFPGVGLGVLAAKAQRITDNMLMASSRALAEQSPMVQTGSGALLPELKHIRAVSRVIAKQVAKQAMADCVATSLPDEAIEARIEKMFWQPEYRTYKRTSF